MNLVEVKEATDAVVATFEAEANRLALSDSDRFFFLANVLDAFEALEAETEVVLTADT